MPSTCVVHFLSRTTDRSIQYIPPQGFRGPERRDRAQGGGRESIRCRFGGPFREDSHLQLPAGVHTTSQEGRGTYSSSTSLVLLLCIGWSFSLCLDLLVVLGPKVKVARVASASGSAESPPLVLVSSALFSVFYFLFSSRPTRTLYIHGVFGLSRGRSRRATHLKAVCCLYPLRKRNSSLSM